MALGLFDLLACLVSCAGLTIAIFAGFWPVHFSCRRLSQSSTWRCSALSAVPALGYAVWPSACECALHGHRRRLPAVFSACWVVRAYLLTGNPVAPDASASRRADRNPPAYAGPEGSSRFVNSMARPLPWRTTPSSLPLPAPAGLLLCVSPLGPARRRVRRRLQRRSHAWSSVGRFPVLLGPDSG